MVANSYRFMLLTRVKDDRIDYSSILKVDTIWWNTSNNTVKLLRVT